MTFILAEEASLNWHPHFDVWLVMGAVFGGYLLILNRVGPKHVSPGDPPASRSQVAAFTLGVLSMWIAADWPIHELAERYLFSVHMVQHLIFSLVSAPLLLLGTPGWLARAILRPKWLLSFMRFLTKPVLALLLFNGFLVFSHWPEFINFVVRSEPAHFLAHFALMTVSLLMWWPVLSPIAELPRLSHPGQMLYLFLQTIVPTVPASFLTFARVPLYEAYWNAPRIIGMSAVTDQMVAGLIMKLGGGFYLWGVIAFLFFRWSSKEDSGTPDSVDWQDIEIELNKTRAEAE